MIFVIDIIFNHPKGNGFRKYRIIITSSKIKKQFISTKIHQDTLKIVNSTEPISVFYWIFVGRLRKTTVRFDLGRLKNLINF